TEQRQGRAVVGLGGFPLVAEGAKIVRLAAKCDGGNPPPLSSLPVNTLVHARCTGSGSRVRLVLLVRADAQIAPSIIQTIVVLVIYEYPGIRQTENEAVHIPGGTRLAAYRIEVLAIPILGDHSGAPAIRQHSLGILGINQRKAAGMLLPAKRNQHRPGFGVIVVFRCDGGNRLRAIG